MGPRGPGLGILGKIAERSGHVSWGHSGAESSATHVQLQHGRTVDSSLQEKRLDLAPSPTLGGAWGTAESVDSDREGSRSRSPCCLPL